MKKEDIEAAKDFLKFILRDAKKEVIKILTKREESK